METALIIVVALQAVTLGVLLYALVQANRKKRELQELLQPILDIVARMKSHTSEGGISIAQNALEVLVKQLGDTPDSSPASEASQSETRKLADLASDPAVHETVEKTARLLKSLFRQTPDPAGNADRGPAQD